MVLSTAARKIQARGRKRTSSPTVAKARSVRKVTTTRRSGGGGALDPSKTGGTVIVVDPSSGKTAIIEEETGKVITSRGGSSIGTVTTISGQPVLLQSGAIEQGRQSALAQREATRKRIDSISKGDTPEEQALILGLAQQEISGSIGFRTLRARKLAQAKEKITDTDLVEAEVGGKKVLVETGRKEATAELAGGRIQVSGTVSTFQPQKDPKQEQLERIRKTLKKQGIDVDSLPSSVKRELIAKDNKQQIIITGIPGEDVGITAKISKSASFNQEFLGNIQALDLERNQQLIQQAKFLISLGKKIEPLTAKNRQLKAEEIEQFEKKVQRIEDIEKNRQKFSDFIGLEKGLENIKEFSDFATSRSPFPQRASGVVQAVIGAPFFGVQALTFAPGVVAKSFATIEAGVGLGQAKSVASEVTRAGASAAATVGEFVASPEGQGFLIGSGLSAVLGKSKIPKELIRTEKFKVPVNVKKGKAKKGIVESKPKDVNAELIGLLRQELKEARAVKVKTKFNNTQIKNIKSELKVLTGKEPKTPKSIIRERTITNKKISEALESKKFTNTVELFKEVTKTKKLRAENRGIIKQIRQEVRQRTGKSIETVVKQVQLLSANRNITVRTIGLEFQGRSQPLATLVTGKGVRTTLKFGTPKFRESLSLESLRTKVQARTATGTKVISELLDITKAEKTRITQGQELIRTLSKETGLKVRDVFFDIEALRNPKRSSLVIERGVAQFGGKVFGTGTIQQLPKGFRTKIGDVDVLFKQLTEAQISKKVIPKLIKGLEKSEGRSLKIGKDKLSIETTGGIKLFEAKAGKGKITTKTIQSEALGFRLDDISTVPFGKTRFFISPTKPLRQARATRAGEQLKRKTQASLFFRPGSTKGDLPKEFSGAGVLPTATRLKDLPGAIVQARGIIALQQQRQLPLTQGLPLRSQAKALKTQRGANALQSFIETFTQPQQKQLKLLIQKSKGQFEFEFDTAKGKLQLKAEDVVIRDPLRETVESEILETEIVKESLQAVRSPFSDPFDEPSSRSSPRIFSPREPIPSPTFTVSPSTITSPDSPILDSSGGGGSGGGGSGGGGSGGGRSGGSGGSSSPDIPSPTLPPSVSPDMVSPGSPSIDSPTVSPSVSVSVSPVEKSPLEIFDGGDKKSPQELSPKGFNAQVKEKGKFQTINKQPLPPNTALNLALKTADETVGVTARVVPTKKPTKIKFDQNRNAFLLNKFEQRKDLERKGVVYVERNKFRIDSPTERRGITLKGLAAQKNKAFGGFA